MINSQHIYQDGHWAPGIQANHNAQLVLLFGSRQLAADQAIRSQISSHFPNAEIMGCTTSGEVIDTQIYDESLCLTAIEFSRSQVKVHTVDINNAPKDAAKTLAEHFNQEGLKSVFVLSDGQMVNGTDLTNTLQDILPEGTIITGGLAGDGTNFSETILWHNSDYGSGKIIGCGFYGDHLQVNHGSMGGWDSFGPKRLITKSQDNILYSVDNKPALDLYKTYLGEHAKDLPASALLFPLLITGNQDKPEVIRTILNINTDDNSMIFAGDIPEGCYAQLMKANFDRLIDGAESAAINAINNNLTEQQNLAEQHDGLIIMISCVGRRLLLKQRTEEELEAVKEVFGDSNSYTGFYSYGEISPLVKGGKCGLHNQTMTITSLFEIDE
ncbi:MAG: hypothetical protein ACJAW8_000197 [Oleispira sp.]|jgi:hypothetical protein